MPELSSTLHYFGRPRSLNLGILHFFVLRGERGQGSGVRGEQLRIVRVGSAVSVDLDL